MANFAGDVNWPACTAAFGNIGRSWVLDLVESAPGGDSVSERDNLRTDRAFLS
jgi:hypothetical protein